MSFGSHDDEDDDIEPLKPLQFNRPDDYGGDIDDQRTNQADMDRLMQPCLDFDDDDDEETNNDSTALKMSDLDDNPMDSDVQDGDMQATSKVEYNMEKYFSNGDVQRK